MFSLNRIEIIGYQTQPLTVRKTPTGTSVVDANLVVPYIFKNKEGTEQSGKSFYTVTLWGPMADTASQFIRPGSQVFFSGRLQTDSWDDTQSGEKRSKTKVVALDMMLLDPRSGQIDGTNVPGLLTQCFAKANIIGNVTKDPEMRTTTSGTNVLSLGVATNERWKEKATGEMKERTEYHNVVIWAELAKAVQEHIRKGSRVHVTGRVQTRSFETQSGQKRSVTEIVADTVTLLGVKSAEALSALQPSAALENNAPQDTNAGMNIPEVKYESEIKPEDLPF